MYIIILTLKNKIIINFYFIKNCKIYIINIEKISRIKSRNIVITLKNIINLLLLMCV